MMEYYIAIKNDVLSFVAAYRECQETDQAQKDRPHSIWDLMFCRMIVTIRKRVGGRAWQRLTK